MARNCKKCGTKIPWGAPQCVSCGAYTHWRSRLATLGIVIGGGTVFVVIVSLARVWLISPPERVRASAEVQEFLEQVAGSDQRHLIGGAGRCKAEIADALCVQATAEFADLDELEQARARDRLADRWQAIAEANPASLVFVSPNGELFGPLGESHTTALD